MKFCSITQLLFLSSNPKILKAFLKTFPTKRRLTECPAGEKKISQEKWKKRGGKKAKSKSQTAVSLLNLKTISKFCFLHMPELHNLIFCIWTRRRRSVWPVNSFVWHDRDQNTTQLQCSFKTRFLAKSPGANGLKYRPRSTLLYR